MLFKQSSYPMGPKFYQTNKLYTVYYILYTVIHLSAISRHVKHKKSFKELTNKYN